MRIGTAIVNAVAIYCEGMNYQKHALEGGALLAKNIVVFLKLRTPLLDPMTTSAWRPE